MVQRSNDPKGVHEHFMGRAEKYDVSSIWITDPTLLGTMKDMAKPQPHELMVDCGCGTGQVGKTFVGSVKAVLGVDVCKGMLQKAIPRLDGCMLGSAERLPFPDNSVDIVTCRAAIQFMDASKALKEMARVVKPGTGRLIITKFNPHQELDQELFFKIIWTRQPYRNRAFNELDIRKLYEDAGITEVRTRIVYTYESTNAWLDNVDLTEEEKENVRNLYRNAPKEYKMLHEVKFVDGDIIDKMRYTVFVGYKPA